MLRNWHIERAGGPKRRWTQFTFQCTAFTLRMSWGSPGHLQGSCHGRFEHAFVVDQHVADAGRSRLIRQRMAECACSPRVVCSPGRVRSMLNGARPFPAVAERARRFPVCNYVRGEHYYSKTREARRQQWRRIRSFRGKQRKDRQESDGRSSRKETSSPGGVTRTRRNATCCIVRYYVGACSAMRTYSISLRKLRASWLQPAR